MHDLRGLSESELESVEHWKQFFRDHKTYFKVGRLSRRPIDPMSPLPPHCDPKKDADQRARWGLGEPPAPPPPRAEEKQQRQFEAKKAEEKRAAAEDEPRDARSGGERTHGEL